ncbi:MAG: DUF1653 domain-containing protein [Limnohabitans sp.]|nr:DUF1653 domain-containing protein [Limnohabitans sp.]
MSTHQLQPLQLTEQGVYRHYKGNLYRVVGTARHSETLEAMTVYRALYGDAGDQLQLWVRPQSMFSEEVVIDGVRQPRFAKIDDSHDTTKSI